MFYRQAGIRHTKYTHIARLFPIPADRWMIGALLALALAAPFYLGPLYLNSYILPWLLWTAAALGLNLVVGWAGQMHLGYAAVMAVGAYSGVHCARAGLPWELAMLVGGGASVLVGSIFAFAALRTKGLYLALTMLAMQFIMDWVLNHVPAISGGSHAALQSPAFALVGMPITSTAGHYYVGLAWCVCVTVFLLNLKRTGLGRALVAVREKDYAAAVLGINSFYFKQLAFAMSSFIAGVSGVLFVANFYLLVSPEQFSVNVSIQVLAMIIVGGLGSIIGTYFGTALILLSPSLINGSIAAIFRFAGLDLDSETLAHLPNAVYGALIIVFLLIEPLGLGKLFANVREYFLTWPFGYLRK